MYKPCSLSILHDGQRVKTDVIDLLNLLNIDMFAKQLVLVDNPT